jgi:hypothetical protein
MVSVEYVPAGQAVQVEMLEAPIADEKRPAGQGTHETSLVAPTVVE